jgi:hypothetical protein
LIAPEVEMPVGGSNVFVSDPNPSSFRIFGGTNGASSYTYNAPPFAYTYTPILGNEFNGGSPWTGTSSNCALTSAIQVPASLRVPASNPADPDPFCVVNFLYDSAIAGGGPEVRVGVSGTSPSIDSYSLRVYLADPDQSRQNGLTVDLLQSDNVTPIAGTTQTVAGTNLRDGSVVLYPSVAGPVVVRVRLTTTGSNAVISAIFIGDPLVISE